MEPRILSRDSFTVVGTLTRVTPESESSEKYGLIWKDFESYHNQIKPHSTDKAYYGVNFATGEEGVFDYIAGMAVPDSVIVPEGLVIREVPAARYAVFECPVHGIVQTYPYVFTEWLPRSPYGLDGCAPVFEQYPPEGETESPVLIHIPIKERG